MSKDDRPAERPRCTALTKAGDQCTNRAQPGELTCKRHAPDGKPLGRPTKLTAELRDTLVELAANGNYRERSAQAVGIGKSTLYGWLERGEADEEAGKPSIYSELLNALTRAEAAAEAEALEAVRKAGAGPLGDWRASAWFLERRYPSRYRRRDSLDVEGDLTFNAVQRVAPEPGEQRVKVARLLAGAGVVDGELAQLPAPKPTRKKGPR